MSEFKDLTVLPLRELLEQKNKADKELIYERAESVAGQKKNSQKLLKIKKRRAWLETLISAKIDKKVEKLKKGIKRNKDV